jgi:hypothetical protein
MEELAARTLAGAERDTIVIDNALSAAFTGSTAGGNVLLVATTPIGNSPDGIAASST